LHPFPTRRSSDLLLALAIARITGDPAASAFDRAVNRLASAARVLADDRGRLPHLGDDDGGALTPLTGRASDDVRDSLAVAAALTACPQFRIGPAPEEAWWMLGGSPLAAELDASRSASTTAPPVSGALPE